MVSYFKDVVISKDFSKFLPERHDTMRFSWIFVDCFAFFCFLDLFISPLYYLHINVCQEHSRSNSDMHKNSCRWRCNHVRIMIGLLTGSIMVSLGIDLGFLQKMEMLIKNQLSLSNGDLSNLIKKKKHMLNKSSNKYKHVQHHTKSFSTPNTPNLSFLELWAT